MGVAGSSISRAPGRGRVRFIVNATRVPRPKSQTALKGTINRTTDSPTVSRPVHPARCPPVRFKRSPETMSRRSSPGSCQEWPVALSLVAEDVCSAFGGRGTARKPAIAIGPAKRRRQTSVSYETRFTPRIPGVLSPPQQRRWRGIRPIEPHPRGRSCRSAREANSLPCPYRGCLFGCTASASRPRPTPGNIGELMR